MSQKPAIRSPEPHSQRASIQCVHGEKKEEEEGERRHASSHDAVMRVVHGGARESGRISYQEFSFGAVGKEEEEEKEGRPTPPLSLFRRLSPSNDTGAGPVCVPRGGGGEGGTAFTLLPFQRSRQLSDAAS